MGHLGFFWKRGSRNRMRTIVAGFPEETDQEAQQGARDGDPRAARNLENDTTGGMSGSTVYKKRLRCGFCTMAIRAYGTYNGPPQRTNNHGTRINRAV